MPPGELELGSDEPKFARGEEASSSEDDEDGREGRTEALAVSGGLEIDDPLRLRVEARRREKSDALGWTCLRRADPGVAGGIDDIVPSSWIGSTGAATIPSSTSCSTTIR